MTPPFVSVIVPCREEVQYVARCLDSILATTYPPDRLEIVVADGMSEDGTREVLARYAAAHPQVRVLDNPARTTPCALNAAVRAARGEVIVRMDAHNEYPSTYVGDLVSWLERSGADNVGGSWHTVPADATARARAIAAALSHPFGVGNAHYRIGAGEPRWVDTVPFGCYRREVFDRIGLFDEELVRNQDDEFNHRLLRRGGRILLVPAVSSTYYARATLQKVGRMMYQYGQFKPLVAVKVGRVVTARQLVPPLFVLALLVLGAASLITWPARIALGVLVGVYAVAVVAVAVRVGTRARSAAVAGWSSVAFAVLHVGYGAGFLSGAAQLAVGSRPGVTGLVPLSR